MIDTSAASFYVSGGTLRQDAPSYVERQADRDLYEGLLRGEYCYVLTSRQMGKSSLMVHTTARLRQEGVAVVNLDLTRLGQNLTVEQWYDGLLGHLGRQLDLEDELEEYWLAHERLSPLQRWFGAIQTVVLARRPGRIVLFLDEIDAVRSLPFSTDEFFAAVRECYNRRSQDPEFQQLTFCLLGVATPSDLIQDTRTTPFNIGRRIELTDFSESVAAPLAQGLGRDQLTSQALLQQVLSWTGGHPYLTQRLSHAVAQDSSIADAAGVDRLCETLFFSPRAQERDDNLLFVRERLLKSESDRASLLDVYARVRGGKRVPDDETNQWVSLLRLSGITRSVSGRLQVRNRIYARVFDRAWVTQHMPDAELRRQRAAFRQGLLRTAAFASVIIATLAALAFSAFRAETRARRSSEERRRALVEVQRQRDRGARLLYAAQMNLAQRAWEAGDIQRARNLLELQQPRPGQPDRRGFEWRYLWRLCRQGDALATMAAHKDVVSSLAYSPDGKTLASGSNDRTVKLWELASRRPIASLQGHTGPVNDVAYSPDGKILASASDDATVRLWDVASRKTVAVLKAHRGPVATVAFSPTGRLLASGSGDNTLKLWDIATRHVVATLKGHRYGVICVALVMSV